MCFKSRDLHHTQLEPITLTHAHNITHKHIQHTQVRLSLERHREELQRQTASLDSQVAMARARLEDAGAEASSLSQRLALERNKVCVVCVCLDIHLHTMCTERFKWHENEKRSVFHLNLAHVHNHTQTHISQVAELEALMAGMRAREYKTDLVSKHGGSQVAIMQERNRILEEQVCRRLSILLLLCTTQSLSPPCSSHKRFNPTHKHVTHNPLASLSRIFSFVCTHRSPRCSTKSLPYSSHAKLKTRRCHGCMLRYVSCV